MPKQKQPQNTSEEQFGVIFPSHLSELNRRVYCARWGQGNVPRHEHYIWIARFLWPEDEWHYWAEDRFESLSNFNFSTWMGPGGCTKTHDAAKFALSHWPAFP